VPVVFARCCGLLSAGLAIRSRRLRDASIATNLE
jgi:hypothetical protein